MHIGKDTLKGKTALVTGAGSGIGRSTAKLLAYAGARVALLGRSPEPLEKVAHQADRDHGDHLVVPADISSIHAMEGAMERIAAEFEALDIVVVNAGINGVWAPLDELRVEEWEKTLDVNLKGTFLTVKCALPLLRKRGGAVVIVSSINGTRVFSNTGATAYSCSKAGQVAFAKMAALELARDGIRVNVVCPGAIETDIDQSTERRSLDEVQVPVEFPEGEIPLTHGAPGTAGQVAQLIWFLVSDASSHITGSEVYIEGGQSLLQG
jgi:NAD(P)-dependent dehydrogenase (short-subunit alcohol dehydrogenase family)